MVFEGETEYVILNADAAELTPRNYITDLILESDDPLHLYQTVPVSFEVTGAFESVTGLTLSAEEGQILLRWEPVSQDAVYLIYRSDSRNFTTANSEIIGETSDNTFIDDTCEEGKSYFYKVVVVIE